MHELRQFRTATPIDKSAITDFLKSTKNFFTVLDTDCLISEVQIQAAMQHAERAENSKVRDLGTLVMMYLSGEAQISKAIESVGVKGTTRNLTVIYKDSEDLENFKHTMHLPEPEENATLPRDKPDSDEQVFGNISKVELNLW